MRDATCSLSPPNCHMAACRSHSEVAPHVHSPFLQGQPPFEFQTSLWGGAIWEDSSRQLTLVKSIIILNCHMSAPLSCRKSKNSNIWTPQRWRHMACPYCFQLYTSESLLRWRHSRTPLGSSSFYFFNYFSFNKSTPWGGAMGVPSEK